MTTSNEDKRRVENSQSGPEVAQRNGPEKLRRVGKSHADYWLPRLIKRSYAWEGKEVEIPEWHARIAHLGRREWFKLTPNKAAAADKARRIFLSLIAKGWDATLAEFKHGSDAAPRLNLTVGDYLRAVEATGQLRIRTFLNYRNGFRTIISEAFGVKSDDSKYDYRSAAGGNRKWKERVENIRLERVTPERVIQWQQRRIKAAGHSPTAIASAKRTANSYIRCARSLFSRDLLKRVKGITLPNPLPFAGVELFDSGSQKYISKLNVQPLIAAARAELKEVQPEVYKAFLLGLFAGLRKGEIDLLEWRMMDWQNSVIKLEQTEWLHLKTNDSAGEITIDAEVSVELREFMGASQSPFIITSDRPARNDSPRAYYRCEPVFQSLNQWLRAKGITANKPLHELRKEIGALIATEHGIYAASRFLRHSDITTTARHYAEHRTRISVGLGKLLDTSIKPVVEAVKVAQ